MNIRAISRNVGYALLVSALFMLFSVGVSLLNGKDSAFSGLVISFILTFSVGIFPFIFVRETEPVSLKDGFMIIVLSWVMSFLFGMLPFLMWGDQFTLENAWFESVSGFTTTGATILEDIEALPPSLLFWRSATHFIGGLGVVVFMLLIIPSASPIRMRLTNMELSNLSKSGYSARTNKTVFIFASVYLFFCVASFACYLAAGMDPLDAICHAFSVSATGGFSTRNLSIAAYDSFTIELISIIFMLLSSLHYGLLYICVVNFTLKPLNNPVFRFYITSLFTFSILMAVSLRSQGLVDNIWQAIHYGSFQTISMITTTGFAVVDNVQWPMNTMILMMFASTMCACAGSTSGGIKADRVLVLFKAIFRHIDKMIHPYSVEEVKLGPRVMRDPDLTPHLVFIGLYCLLIAISTCVLLQFGVNSHSAFSASISCLSNVGPAMAEIGNFGNFNTFNGASKFFLTIIMFLGRVEIYPALAVISMLFEKRHK